ncbi:LCP family protein [Clostridium sp. WB02_MRS01]|uniref:LCP family protein n=1 Tax=Clostridium sp. WB02_MRS01 TaxID=2605777 RepID=UPI002570C24B|nr:LCP family protein [Clostridium sp. WB02_MRS01]
MRNEFDDEVGREDIRKRKRGYDSKPDPSDDDYYLDDDYDNYQEQKYSRSNQSAAGHDLSKKADDVSVRRGGAGERTRSADRSKQSSGDGQAAFRGQPSSAAGSGKSHGAAGNRVASGNSQGTAGSRVVSVDGQRAAGSRADSVDGQRAAANRTAAGISQGASVNRASGNSQRAAGGRTASGNVQGSSRGQIVIGDGGTKQQQRVPAQDKSVAASRSAAQAEKKRKVRRVILMVVLEIFTLAGIFAYAYVARLMGSINRPDDFNKSQVSNDILSPIQKQHMTGYRTIAIFGLDGRDGSINKGSNSDLIMICNINRDTGEIRLVSVYRDTYMSIGEGYSYNKINAAYANGGAAQALAALNRDLDLDITEFVTFNWKSVADGINMLGGVDIDITKPEFRYINSFITETVKETGVPSVHLKSAGMNHLDGVQAVAYARLRKMDTDFQRTERQRLVIEKTFEKAKKADLGLLNRILLMEVDQIGSNLTFSDFTELLLDINKYHIGKTGGFPFTRGDMTVGKRGDCVIPQTLESNVSELHKLLFDKEDYEPSDMVKKISAKIAADTGMYKQGSTSNNSTKDDDSKKATEATKPEKTTAAEESSAQEGSTETTDGSGKPGKPTDPSESSTGETKETKPGESRPSETTTGATKPGETKPSPSTGEPETTTSPHGPGPGQTTAPNETTAPQTSSAGPGGPGETTSSHPSNPSNGGGSDVPIVVQPPTNN